MQYPLPKKKIAPLAGLFLAILIVGTTIMLPACSGNALERDKCDSIKQDSALIAMRLANDLTDEALRYADSVLANIPLERKAAMMLMPAVFASAKDFNLRHIIQYTSDLGVGGFVLLKGDLASAAIISDTLTAIANPAPFISVDAENGLRMRFSDAPEFPWNRELGRLTDDQVMYEFGREIARECRLVGINMVLGPVMDIVPDEGSHGLMRKRSLGSNHQRVADLAIAYSRGLEDGNVISVAKHFPGHGSASADSHKALGEIFNNRDVIDSIDLYPFRKFISEQLTGIMIGHLSVKALDSIRRPAVASPIIMKDLLRTQLGFNGLIITDALNMDGAAGISAWQTIAAGADMVIAPADTREEIFKITKAVERGDLDEKIVDDRCRRILFYKFLFSNSGDKKALRENLIERVNEKAPDVRNLLQ